MTLGTRRLTAVWTIADDDWSYPDPDHWSDDSLSISNDAMMVAGKASSLRAMLEDAVAGFDNLYGVQQKLSSLNVYNTLPKRIIIPANELPAEFDLEENPLRIDTYQLQAAIDHMHYVAKSSFKAIASLASEVANLANSLARIQEVEQNALVEVLVESLSPIATMEIAKWDFANDLAPFRIGLRPKSVLMVAKFGNDWPTSSGQARRAVMGWAKEALEVSHDMPHRDNYDCLQLHFFDQADYEVVQGMMTGVRWSKSKSEVDRRRKEFEKSLR